MVLPFKTLHAYDSRKKRCVNQLTSELKTEPICVDTCEDLDSEEKCNFTQLVLFDNLLLPVFKNVKSAT